MYECLLPYTMANVGHYLFSHLLKCFFEIINKKMRNSKIYLFLSTLGIYFGVTLSVHSTESLSVYYWGLDHKDETDPRAHNPVQKINTSIYRTQWEVTLPWEALVKYKNTEKEARRAAGRLEQSGDMSWVLKDEQVFFTRQGRKKQHNQAGSQLLVFAATTLLFQEMFYYVKF